MKSWAFGWSWLLKLLSCNNPLHLMLSHKFFSGIFNPTRSGGGSKWPPFLRNHSPNLNGLIFCPKILWLSLKFIWAHFGKKMENKYSTSTGSDVIFQALDVISHLTQFEWNYEVIQKGTCCISFESMLEMLAYQVPKYENKMFFRV